MYGLLKCIFTGIFLVTCCLSQSSQNCDIADSECQRKFFQNTAINFSKTGIPAIGVPVLDPFHMKNVYLNFMGVSVTLNDGDATGIGKCILMSYETDLENFYKRSEIICNNITIQGHYTMKSDAKAQAMIGRDFHGDGNVVIELLDWYFKMSYPFKVVRHDDGEIYLRGYFNESENISEVRGRAKFYADHVMLNDNDISEYIVKFLNENWKMIMSYFVKPIHDKSIEYYYDIYGLFFERVPAKNYISGDLSKYVKNK